MSQHRSSEQNHSNNAWKSLSVIFLPEFIFLFGPMFLRIDSYLLSYERQPNIYAGSNILHLQQPAYVRLYIYLFWTKLMPIILPLFSPLFLQKIATWILVVTKQKFLKFIMKGIWHIHAPMEVSSLLHICFLLP